MPGKQPLARPADVVFLYDGTYPGFLCCVHLCVYSREEPAAIFAEADAQPTLFATRGVETDPEKAERVHASIRKKIGLRAEELVRTGYLSCMEQKELKLLRFLLLGYREGPKTPNMMGHPDVAPVLAAEKHLLGEAHLYKGFARFSDYDGVLAGSISPKNFVLPFVADHFVDRYPGEDFLLYDKTHKAALLYQNRRMEIVPMEWIDFPEADETELAYRAMWKRFYKTISIEARENPRCRMTHMPKRYWADMLEVTDELHKSGHA